MGTQESPLTTCWLSNFTILGEARVATVHSVAYMRRATGKLLSTPPHDFKFAIVMILRRHRDNKNRTSFLPSLQVSFFGSRLDAQAPHHFSSTLTFHSRSKQMLEYVSQTDFNISKIFIGEVIKELSSNSRPDFSKCR